jgi:hypothetical protein
VKTILDHIKELPQKEWDYYYEIERDNSLKNPFTDKISYTDFIRKYFTRGGKVKLLNTININISDLRFPNHISSVFFIGILIYKKTDLSKKYQLGVNDPGYDSFAFLWFLITLFHDYSYSVENNSSQYRNISSLDELYEHFSVTEKLFDFSSKKMIPRLLKMRKRYFEFRLKTFKKIDHGLLSGILMYDRLVKIRRQKKQNHEDDLFWDQSLEHDYETAANAISIHNIWIPNKTQYALYKKYKLDKLIRFKPVQSQDFTLFYLLGIIDTIDPVKTYTDDKISDTEILSSIYLTLKKASIIFQNKKKSKLDFSKLIWKTQYFKGWLDVEIVSSPNKLEIKFR